MHTLLVKSKLEVAAPLVLSSAWLLYSLLWERHMSEVEAVPMEREPSRRLEAAVEVEGCNYSPGH